MGTTERQRVDDKDSVYGTADGIARCLGLLWCDGYVEQGETHCDVAAGGDDLPLQLTALGLRVFALVAQQAAGPDKLPASATGP